MRVYAESNFVLEIALEQEQHQACNELVSLAASKSIELVLPAFALLEPYQTVVRRKNEWKALHKDQLTHAQQLERTAWISADVPLLRDAADLMLRAEQEISKRFLDIRSKLLDVARFVEIDDAVLREASAMGAQLGLELPDAVMLASVLADAIAHPSPSIFLNRNTKDFDDPDVKARLKNVPCDLVWKFDHGIARVKNAL